jgi:4-hydroxy-tetrahydrodipicolinate synthase
MAEMVRAALANDWAAARRINRQFFRLMQANFAEPSPAPVKALLAIRGLGDDGVRLPMVPVSKATRAKLEQMAGELGLLVSQPPTGEDLRMF